MNNTASTAYATGSLTLYCSAVRTANVTQIVYKLQVTIYSGSATTTPLHSEATRGSHACTDDRTSLNQTAHSNAVSRDVTTLAVPL